MVARWAVKTRKYDDIRSIYIVKQKTLETQILSLMRFLA